MWQLSHFQQLVGTRSESERWETDWEWGMFSHLKTWAVMVPAATFTCLSSTSSQYLIASQCHCFTVRLRFWILCLPQNNTASASPSLNNHGHSKLQHTFRDPHTLLLYVCRRLDSHGSSSALLRGATHKLQHVLNQPNSTGLTELWMKSSAEGISCVPDPHLLFLPMKCVVS